MHKKTKRVTQLAAEYAEQYAFFILLCTRICFKSPTYTSFFYEGESNEKLKRAIKILNTARLSCKLTTMILMV